MTFSKIVTSTPVLTVYLENANDPSKGFRVALGGVVANLSTEDARELAEYLWVRLPDGLLTAEDISSLNSDDLEN